MARRRCAILLARATAGHFEVVFLPKFGHPLGVCPRVLILLLQRCDLLEIRRTVWTDQLCQLGEVVLEARGANDLEQSGWLGAGVPEGVCDAPRLDDVGARFRRELLIADADADRTLPDVGLLVLVGVHVRRRERAWCDGVLDDRQQPTGLLAEHFEDHATSRKTDLVTLFRF